jgi:tetratricopeptide (TPR) repeat protein
MESKSNSVNTNNQSTNTNCPYTNFINKFSFFKKANKNENKLEETSTTLKTIDTEKGVDDLDIKKYVELGNISNVSKCPFNQLNPTETPLINSSDEITSEVADKKCPVNHANTMEDDDEDEEKPQGGCPVSNKYRKDPPNRHYEPVYEVPRFGQFDFMFLMRGGVDEEEFLEKTKTIRSLPRHMKYTLFFQNQEKLAKVHILEFPRVFFLYDDIKEKGNRMFRRKKYREAIEHYIYAYGLLKWIQFKDKKRQEEFLKKPSLDPILDSDIEVKQVYLDDVQVEEDSFKACVVFLLLNMSYAYMELRHFYEAIECLDECEKIAEDKISDVYFRRSQARAYNRSSCDEELEIAIADIDKAINVMKKEENLPMYKEHKEILMKIIKKRNLEKIESAKTLIVKAKKSHDRIKVNKFNPDDVIYTKNKDAMTQYKIMKE